MSVSRVGRTFFDIFSNNQKPASFVQLLEIFQATRIYTIHSVFNIIKVIQKQYNQILICVKCLQTQLNIESYYTTLIRSDRTLCFLQNYTP